MRLVEKKIKDACEQYIYMSSRKQPEGGCLERPPLVTLPCCIASVFSRKQSWLSIAACSVCRGEGLVHKTKLAQQNRPIEPQKYLDLTL